MTEYYLPLSKPDTRPKKGAWAPGDYENTCFTCGNRFIGDKRAKQCAACAYEENTESSRSPAG